MRNTILFIFSFTLIFANSSFAQGKKPNILFITIDDLKPMLGCYGDNYIQSPNIDKLASQSVVFDNAYVQQAVCAVSRVSIFSGQRPDRTKVWDLQTDMRRVNPSVITLPQFFKDRGYETTGLGKLMHGAKDNDPISWTIASKNREDLDYPEQYGYPANGRYQNKDIQLAFKEAKKLKLGWKKTNQYLKKEGMLPPTESMDVPDNAYTDGAVADEGIKLLNKFSKTDKPFFLAIGFSKPHLPFVAPKKYWDLYNPEDIKLAEYQEEAENAPSYAYHTFGELRAYSGIPQNGPVDKTMQKHLIHGYHASVSYVDAQVGKLIDELKRLGQDKNTIIVLWGDHGWHLGDHGLWAKHSNFEQATKIPFIIYSPDGLKGKRASTMTEMVDVYPTLLDFAGFEIPEKLEGKSLVAVTKDQQVQVKDYAISQYPRGKNVMGYTLRVKDYRYTVWLKGKFHEKALFLNPNIVGEELYDYVNDPLETKSLAKDEKYKEKTNELRNKLFSLLKEQNNKFGY